MRRLLGAVSLLSLLAVAVGCGASRTALNEAVFAGDPARVRKVLDDGASTKVPGACGPEDTYPTTALVCAIENDRFEIVRLLLERGADPNQPEYFGANPLMVAAKKNVEVVRLLLEKGAAIDGQGSDLVAGRTALMRAVDFGKADVARFLLDRGASVNVRSAYGWTALGIAAEDGRTDLARMLLAKGADVDYAISKAESMVTNGSQNARNKNLASVRFLRDLKENFKACSVRYRHLEIVADAAFAEAAETYRAAAPKPGLPEEGRVFRVQAEDAVGRTRFQDAVDLYGKALKIAPWWPEGHFNQALILSESECHEEAIAEMERYLALVPDAPDARAARDRIYQWKGRIP